eukprot:4555576-Pyramimonas_sp.AAC.1
MEAPPKSRARPSRSVRRIEPLRTADRARTTNITVDGALRLLAVRLEHRRAVRPPLEAVPHCVRAGRRCGRDQKVSK